MATVVKNKIEKPYLTDEERWEAVIHREKMQPMIFFYSVKNSRWEPLPFCPNS